MSKNLQNILGLGEPKTLNGASGVEAKAFKKAFQTAMKQVAKSLQFTAVHAVDEEHRDLDVKRDKVILAYQAVARKMDPDNPRASQAAIKRLKQSVSHLRGGAEALEDYAAKHHAAWIENEEKLDDAAEQVAEMVAWGYSNSEKLEAVITAIRDQAKLRKYKEAVEALQKFLEKLQPAYDDFVVQRDAKIDFEQMIEDNHDALDSFGSSNHELLSEWRAEIQGNLDSVEMSVDALDYFTALANLEAELPMIEDYLKEYAYEAALSALQPKLDKLDANVVWSAAATTANDLRAEMERAVTSGDFVLALETLQKLEPEVDAQLESMARIDYETAAAKHATTFDAADATSDRRDDLLKQWKDGYETSKTALDKLTAAGKWDEALLQLPSTASAAEQFIDQEAAYGKLLEWRSNYPTDDQWFENFGKNTPPDPIWNEELLIFRTYREKFSQGDFQAALKKWLAFFAIRADLKTRVDSVKTESAPAAAAAEDKIRKMAGVSDLRTLDQAGKDKLIKKLEKLPPKKQRQLWKDLRLPASPLGAEQQIMQAALFDAMQLDKEFKRAETKLRDAYEAELYDDAELEQAIKNWDATDATGAPLVDEATKKELIQRAINTQSKAYGIDVPEIDWDASHPWGAAEFSAETNRITINPSTLQGAVAHTCDPSAPSKFSAGSESIALMLHENAHNFQDELVKKYLRGEIGKDDPMYAQAELFAYNIDDGYLELGGSCSRFDLYSQQPSERHSYVVQESAVDTLLNRNPPK